jgi:hypothetical protein
VRRASGQPGFCTAVDACAQQVAFLAPCAPRFMPPCCQPHPAVPFAMLPLLNLTRACRFFPHPPSVPRIPDRRRGQPGGGASPDRGSPGPQGEPHDSIQAVQPHGASNPGRLEECRGLRSAQHRGPRGRCCSSCTSAQGTHGSSGRNVTRGPRWPRGAPCSTSGSTWTPPRTATFCSTIPR